MRPIPLKMRTELSEDTFMKRCAIFNNNCFGKVEFHHVWIYAGRQINEKWAIVPACKYHHDQVNGNPEIKRIFEKISLRRATEEELLKFPKKDWGQIKKFLKI